MKKEIYRKSYVIPFILVVGGLLVIIVAAHGGKFLKSKESVCSEVATAKVISILEDTSGKYIPVIEYNTGSEVEEYTAELAARKEIGDFKVGRTVKVNYNPENPSEFFLSNSTTYMFMFIVIGSVGLVFVLSGIITYGMFLTYNTRNKKYLQRN